MKLRKSVGMFTIAVALLLGACSNQTPSNSKEAEPSSPAASQTNVSANEKVELSWIAQPAYSLQGTDPKRVEYLESAIDEWQKKHENVVLKPDVESTNINEAMAKLLEQAAQGRAPDVAQIDAYLLPRYIKYLQPLDPYIKKAGLDMNDFFPFAKNVVTGPDGKIYGIQFTTDTRVLFYRKDLVPNPPQTWEELLTIGKKLKADGYDSFLVPGGKGEAASITSILPLFWGQKGRLIDDNGKAVFGTGEDREKMLNVFNFYHQAVQEGVLDKKAASFATEADLNQEVAVGKLAMFLGGNFQVSQLKSIIGEEAMANWDVAPIPQKDAGAGATSAGGWAWGIFSKDPNVQQAGFDLIMDVYAGDEGMTQWTTIAGYLPTRKSIYDNPGYAKTEYTDTFKKLLDEQAQMRPSEPVYTDISLQLQTAISSIISGAKKPEEALNDAWTSVSNK